MCPCGNGNDGAGPCPGPDGRMLCDPGVREEPALMKRYLQFPVTVEAIRRGGDGFIERIEARVRDGLREFDRIFIRWHLDPMSAENPREIEPGDLFVERDVDLVYCAGLGRNDPPADVQYTSW